MAGIGDLGNGSGYVYITQASASVATPNILSNIVNDKRGYYSTYEHFRANSGTGLRYWINANYGGLAVQGDLLNAVEITADLAASIGGVTNVKHLEFNITFRTKIAAPDYATVENFQSANTEDSAPAATGTKYYLVSANQDNEDFQCRIYDISNKPITSISAHPYGFASAGGFDYALELVSYTTGASGSVLNKNGRVQFRLKRLTPPTTVLSANGLFTDLGLNVALNFSGMISFY